MVCSLLFLVFVNLNFGRVIKVSAQIFPTGTLWLRELYSEIIMRLLDLYNNLHTVLRYYKKNEKKNKSLKFKKSTKKNSAVETIFINLAVLSSCKCLFLGVFGICQ